MRYLGIAAVILALSGCRPPPAPVLSPFADGKDLVLLKPMKYQVADTGHVIIVPKGFVTDLASIPRGFCIYMGRLESHGRAAIVHDYLYWSQVSSREQADKLLLLAMEESCVGKPKRTSIYAGVRLGGKSAWESNRNERQSGLPRIIPEKYLPLPPDATWKEYRKILYDAGVRPRERGPSEPPPGWCDVVK